MFLHKQLPDSRRDDRFTMFAERASSLLCVTRCGSPGDEKVITLMRIAAPRPIRLGLRKRRTNWAEQPKHRHRPTRATMAREAGRGMSRDRTSKRSC